MLAPDRPASSITQAPPSRASHTESSSRRQPFVWLFIVTTLVTGVAWGVAIPPFEGPDESAFYKDLMNYAHGRAPGSLPLYALTMKPALKLAGGQDKPFQAKYNPSFRFTSNRWGRVNMFMHGRSEGMLRADLNRMYLLRFLTLGLWLATFVLIFATAGLFFGGSDLALLTAGLCVSIPQLSFFASKIHPEATSTLLASIAYLVFTMRVYGRIGRVSLWVAGLVLLGLTPFSDRQAYFLILLIPFGLVTTETNKRNGAIAAAVLLVPGLLLLTLHQFGDLQRDLQTWAAPFSAPYRAGWWNRDTPEYLVFEFLPKLFFGFCGWLGQPSILLPPPVYAAMAISMALAAAGLCLRSGRAPLTREQRQVAWIFAAGVFLTVAPIVYTNVLISRNSWYGRWLFPSIAPIMIGLVVGFRSFVMFARRRAHVAGGVLLGLSIVLALVWLSRIGDAVRAGIRANHYGDQNHLIATVGDFIAALGVAAVAVGVLRLLEQRVGASAERRVPVLVFAVSWALNLVLLFAFVAPLYRPLDADALAAAVRAEAAEGEFGRATALYNLAVAANPASTMLRRIETEIPLLVLNSGDDRLLAGLQARISRGDEKLSSRAELMTLARVAQMKHGFEPEVLRKVAERVSDTPELREPLALIRAESEGPRRDRTAADIVRAAGGVATPHNMHHEAMLEGYTERRDPAGHNEVTVYLRPLRQWAGRRLWMHAYPAGSQDYLVIEPAPPAFAGWRPDELAWETFQLPSNARYVLYVGVEVAYDLGPAYPLGTIGP